METLINGGDVSMRPFLILNLPGDSLMAFQAKHTLDRFQGLVT